jgi:hypothetical protein
LTTFLFYVIYEELGMGNWALSPCLHLNEPTLEYLRLFLRLGQVFGQITIAIARI